MVGELKNVATEPLAASLMRVDVAESPSYHATILGVNSISLIDILAVEMEEILPRLSLTHAYSVLDLQSL